MTARRSAGRTCNHVWKPYADATRIWTVCLRCNEERHCTTHAEHLAQSLAYIFRDFGEAYET